MSHLPSRHGKCVTCRQPITKPPIELTALGRLVASKVPKHYKVLPRHVKTSAKEVSD
jgi:hypothetical protein